MKKFLSGCLLLCILTSTFGITAFAAPTQGYVTADVLNVRSQAYIGDNVIGSLYYGQAVTVDYAEGEWYHISYNGTGAYVHSDYITIYPAGTTSRGSVDRSKGQAVIDLAKTFLGTPYVYGGASPSGFDCSGFVYYLYQQFGVSLYRTAAGQAQNGIIVSREEMIPGDIILFSSSGGPITHVGLYVGDGQFIHSPQTGKTVEIVPLSSSYYDRGFMGARRIFY